MMTKHLIRVFVFLFVFITLFSCSKYQKILKSDDLEHKYESALKYYDDQEYFKAMTLFEEMIGLYRGLDKAEKIYYYYAYCNYYMEDYILAAYYFKNFLRTYPTSKHAEECAFIAAYCYYLNSPEPSLDQSNTMKAIEELKIFTNRYAKSDKVEECNNLIDMLRDKLEIKTFNNAKLYFNLSHYKAAVVSFNNLIIDYPDTRFKEEAYFLILKSNYLLALNSVDSKKKERFESTMAAYNAFEGFRPIAAKLGEDNSNIAASKDLAKEAELILENSKEYLNGINKNNKANMKI